jgi:sugar lactone lactonase YvrE
VVLRFGSEGTGAGRFEDARSVAVDGAGRIYVAEYSGGRVQVFDSLGTFVTQWTADPRMPLLDLEVDRGGTVYVVQSGRIRRYEGATGRLLGTVAGAGQGVNDLVLALDGTLWVANHSADVVHLSRDGKVLRRVDLRQAVQETPRRHGWPYRGRARCTCWISGRARSTGWTPRGGSWTASGGRATGPSSSAGPRGSPSTGAAACT